MAKITKPGGAKPAQPKSKYAGVTSAKVSRDGNYITPATYIALIERVEEGTSQNAQDFVAINLTILAVDGSGRSEMDERGGPANRVGESVSDWNGAGVVFAGNMMAFAMAATGMSQEEIQEAEEYDGQFIEEMVGEDQPLAGRVVELRVGVRKTKDAKTKDLDTLSMGKGLFTKCTYLRRVPYAELADLVDEDVLARFIPDLDEKIAEESEAE